MADTAHLQQQPQANRTPTHHRHHHTAYHSQFASKDKADTNIPSHIKTFLVEQSPRRKQIYEPDKVIVRTETKLVSRDAKTVAVEKAKRMQDVLRSGFAADSKECYKALGDPIVDSDQLMFEALDMESPNLKKPTHVKTQEVSTRAKEAGIPALRNLIPHSGTVIKTSNGYDILKDKILSSKERLYSVKFGVPFNDVCPNAEQVLHSETEIAMASDPEHEDHIDYSCLTLDPIKMQVYRSLLEHREGYPKNHDILFARMDGSITGVGDVATQANRRKSVSARRGSTAVGIPGFRRTSMAVPADMPHTAVSMSEKLMSIASRGSVGQANLPGKSTIEIPNNITHRKSTVAEVTYQMSSAQIKSLEADLKVRRPQKLDPTAQLLMARDEFYLEQEKSNQTLDDELEKLDVERPVTFLRKYKAFEVGATTIFVDDIAKMRLQAQKQKYAEKHRQLREHPWYNEMVRVVFYCNGTKKDISETEQTLLKRIKACIEEKVEWNQPLMISLLKMVPQSEFQDLQKIFRYIKTAETMGEREYLEAIELSGHTV